MVFRIAQSGYSIPPQFCRGFLTTLIFGYFFVCVTTVVNAQIIGPGPTTGDSDRVAFLSGVVTLPDGSHPPTPVLIQQVCSGQVTGTAWTDVAGRFSFMLGSNASGSIANDTSYDPSMPAYLDRSTRSPNPYGNSITTLPRDCEVQAVLAGFRSDHVGIAVRTALDNNRVGTIVLHPLSKAGALTVSTTTLQAPNGARKAYDKGMAAMRARKWQAAVVDFNKSVTAYPTYALAWYELGRALAAQDDTAGAIEAWKRSLASDQQYVSPYEQLCALTYQKGDWIGLAEYSHSWIQLNGEEFPAAFLYNSFADSKLNKLNDAETLAREGLRIDKEHRFPRLSFMLGFVLLEKHQYSDSAKYLRSYLDMVPNARDADAVREQLARLAQVTAMASSADGPTKP